MPGPSVGRAAGGGRWVGPSRGYNKSMVWGFFLSALVAERVLVTLKPVSVREILVVIDT